MIQILGFQGWRIIIPIVTSALFLMGLNMLLKLCLEDGGNRKGTKCCPRCNNPIRFWQKKDRGFHWSCAFITENNNGKLSDYGVAPK